MEQKELTPEERRRKKKKILKERRSKIYTKISCIFLLLVILTCIFNLISGDKEFSETENRVLAQKPEFSLSNLASGKFMTDMEDYVADQFFMRDQWISLKLFEDMALGKRESNGVYIGKNHTLLEIPETPDMESVDKNLDAIYDFSNRHVDVNTVMALVPNAAYICDQLRPANAPVRDQSQDLSHARAIVGTALDFVDMEEVMSAHKEEYIYYKTDHHWTSLGAYYAFEALCPALGITSPAADYDIYPVSTSFSGTLSSKSGYHKETDTIEIYVPKNVSSECVVNYIDETRKTTSIYDSSALEQKDQYEVFFGGNYSRIDISAPNEENKNLLLIKDSYANCFVQFLLPYFRNIIIVDPRYYYDDLDRLIEDQGITDVLFLYNVNTFMTDRSLADALEAAPEENTTTVPEGTDAGTAGGGSDVGGSAESGSDAEGTDASTSADVGAETDTGSGTDTGSTDASTGAETDTGSSMDTSGDGADTGGL